MIVWKTALCREFSRIAKSAKKPIPPRNISVVERVEIELMVNGVVLGSLQEVAHPLRRSQIAVVKVLSEDSEHVVPGARGWRCSQNRKHECARDHRIGGDLDGVLVEGRQ